jgi:curli biogenesis system outer membrane secretion channel CsgG
MKPVITAALAILAATTSTLAQPTDIAQRFDCSAFTHILWACLPPSNARDSANAMASAFMSAAIRLGRERHMSDGKLHAAAMTALQRQRAKSGNICSRLDVLVQNYGKACDALMDADKLLAKPTEVRTSGPG